MKKYYHFTIKQKQNVHSNAHCAEFWLRFSTVDFLCSKQTWTNLPEMY